MYICIDICILGRAHRSRCRRRRARKCFASRRARRQGRYGLLREYSDRTPVDSNGLQGAPSVLHRYSIGTPSILHRYSTVLIGTLRAVLYGALRCSTVLYGTRCSRRPRRRRRRRRRRLRSRRCCSACRSVRPSRRRRSFSTLEYPGSTPECPALARCTLHAALIPPVPIGRAH